MGQPGAVVHDFRERLAYSVAASDEAFWDAIYRKAFPNIVSHMLCDGDFQTQRAGIDRAILLSNGRTLYIDEKKRQSEYGDILLEHISNTRTGAPGWINKDLAIDYLAYAFMQSKRVYLFPWPMLRRAWVHYGDAWIKIYHRVEAQNKGYATIGVAVPIDILRSACHSAEIIQL